MLVAGLHKGDPRHDEARTVLAKVWAGEFGVPVSNEHVLDEGITLLRKRVGRPEIAAKYASLFFGAGRRDPPLRMRSLGVPELERALALHLERFDRGLSFTDCVLVVMARDLDAQVASFDRGFDGIVQRIP